MAIIHRSEIEATAWLPQITVSEINRRDLVLVAAEVEPETGVAEHTPLKEVIFVPDGINSVGDYSLQWVGVVCVCVSVPAFFTFHNGITLNALSY